MSNQHDISHTHNQTEISATSPPQPLDYSVSALLRDIIDGTTDKIAALDLEGRYLAFNKAYEEEMLQTFGKQIAVGMSLRDAFAHLPEDQARVLEIWNRACAGEEYTTLTETGGAHGSRHVYEGAFNNLRDQEGRLTGAVGVFRDATRRVDMAQALIKSEARLKAAQSVAQIGSWEFDVALNQITWSDEMFRLRQRDPDLGEPNYEEVLSIYVPEDAARLDAALQRAIKDGVGYELELRRVTPDGTIRYIRAIGKPIVDDTGTVVRLIGTSMDITANKQAEQELQTANLQLEYQILLANEQAVALEVQKLEMEEASQRLTALTALAVTDGLTALYNHRAFQEGLAQECERSQRYKTPLSLLLLDVDKFKLYNDTFGHLAGDEVLKSVAGVLQGTARDTDYVCRYGGEEFVLILPNTDARGAIIAAERLRTAVQQHDWTLRPITASFGIATLNAEMTTAEELIIQADKALYTSKEKGRNCLTHFAALSVLKELEELAGNTSLPFSDIVREMLQIQQDTLASASNQIRDMMMTVYDATILSWSRLLDMKDKETEGHGERVTEMMRRLAHSIGMNAEEAMYARWGALLHDVGKMSVPDSILHKPGPLTAEEWVIMRQHTTVAYEMLSPVNFLRPALDIPLYHHEKWDGTGYPRGLKGEDIPIVARLFAVIDVYDSLTTDRPYREAWSQEKTIAHLQSLSGTHFDPRAINVFLAMLSETKLETKLPQSDTPNHLEE